MPEHAPKHEFLTRLNEGFARLGGWSFDHRWLVVGLTCVLVVGCFYLAGQVRQDNSYEAYFDPDDGAYLAYEQYREDFGSDEVSYILYEVPGVEHGPWNLAVMQKLLGLTTALEDEVPFVYEVTTLTNAELTRGVEDGIEIFELEDDFPATQAELLSLRDAYLDKPMLVGGILSEDARYGAIIIEMDLSSTDPPEVICHDPERCDDLENLYPQVTEAAIEAILARPEYDEFTFYHSGDVPLNAIYNRMIFVEAAFLDQVTSIVIALLLAFFFRSIVGVIGPLVVVHVGLIACVAFIASIDWSVSMGFASMPTLLTAIGIAHSVHILSEFRARFGALLDRREALVQTFYLVGAPCLLTSLTTAAGFGAMSFVPIRSVSEMGTYGAFGVMAAFVLSFTLLTSLLSFGRRTRDPIPVEKQMASAKGGERMRAVLVAIANFDLHHRRAILATFGGIFLLSVVGMTRIVADSNWLDDFSYDMPIKSITETVDRVMGGTTNVIYLFDAGEADGIKDPAVLREIERVQRIAEEEGGDYLRKTYSIVDILKDLNQAFHGGDLAWHKLPDSRELVAQYLLLYEMSGGEETEEYVSSDYRRASLELRLALGRTSQTAALVDGIEAELDRAPLEASAMSVTGIGALWLKLMDYIVTSQVRGFLLAFSAVAFMMVFIFRSLGVGIISMVPNLTPVVLTLGVMGWWGILLDYSKVSIAAVALGIAVDDTIHLISRYRHEFRRRGDYVEALVVAMEDVGRALMITSIALVSGFMVLTLSVMDTTAMQGILLSTTIVTALLADFFLMPALVLTFEPFGPEGRRASTSSLKEAA